jgi:ATP-dependent RNA helicase DHX40
MVVLMFPNFIVQAVTKAMKIHTESPPGHILLFLTGQDEIERCCDQLFDKAENLDYRYDVCSRRVNAMLVLPLYGSMPTGNESSTSSERSTHYLNNTNRFK